MESLRVALGSRSYPVHIGTGLAGAPEFYAPHRPGGRVAVVKRHGARLAVREVRWGQVRATHDGMLVDTGDRRFGKVTVVGINVLDIRRLAPSLTSV